MRKFRTEKSQTISLPKTSNHSHNRSKYQQIRELLPSTEQLIGKVRFFLILPFFVIFSIQIFNYTIMKILFNIQTADLEIFNSNGKKR